MTLIVLPEIALKRVLDYGIIAIKEDDSILDEIFAYYQEGINADIYDKGYMKGIHTFIHEYDIPVIQGWTLNDQVIPCYSIASNGIRESVEDEAIGDILGMDQDEGLQGTMMLNYSLEVGIHTTKTVDHSIWLNTILIYILYQYQSLARDLGLISYIFSNPPLSKSQEKTFDNIYSRTLNLECRVQNTWIKDPGVDITDLQIRMLKARAKKEKLTLKAG